MATEFIARSYITIFNEAFVDVIAILLVLYMLYIIVVAPTPTPTPISNNDKKKKKDEEKILKVNQDMTVQELRQFDGTQEDGRILIALNGHIYDVTKAKRIYGPNGPFSYLAGRDASRNLATFTPIDRNSIEYDDLSDLNEEQLEFLRKSERQFSNVYVKVGKLLVSPKTDQSIIDDVHNIVDEEEKANDADDEDNSLEDEDRTSDEDVEQMSPMLRVNFTDYTAFNNSFDEIFEDFATINNFYEYFPNVAESTENNDEFSFPPQPYNENPEGI